MKTSNIYVFTNKINGKKYVGQSVNPTERYKQHLRNKNNKHIIFYNAINKYGIDNFDFEIIETNIPIDKIDDREKFWIKELNSMKPNGYNMTEGGEGTQGYVHTEESKQRMSMLKKGKYVGKNNPNYGATWMCGENNPNYGKHLSDETKEKISIANKGKCRSEEVKKQISETSKSITHTEEWNKNVSIGLNNMSKEDKYKMINKRKETIKSKKEQGLWEYDCTEHFKNMSKEDKEIMYDKISNNNPRRKDIKGIKLDTNEEFVFQSIGKAGKWIHETYGFSINAKNVIRRSIETNGTAYGFKWFYI